MRLADPHIDRLLDCLVETVVERLLVGDAPSPTSETTAAAGLLPPAAVNSTTSAATTNGLQHAECRTPAAPASSLPAS
jgi:hypothetical protein